MDSCYVTMYGLAPDLLTDEVEMDLMEHYFDALHASMPGLKYSFVEFCHDCEYFRAKLELE